MDNRIEFHNKLKTILPDVYFQPPNNTSIQYPAIIYERKDIVNIKASDSNYRVITPYNVKIIDRNPDSKFIDKLMEFEYCIFDRQFVSGGLNHFVFTIYN